MDEDDRQVADADCFAVDQWGVRRLIRAGDRLPVNWRVESTPRTKTRRAPRAKPEPESEIHVHVHEAEAEK